MVNYILEGFGDEVTIFFGCLLVVVTLTLTWISTAVQNSVTDNHRGNVGVTGNRVQIRRRESSDNVSSQNTSDTRQELSNEEGALLSNENSDEIVQRNNELESKSPEPLSQLGGTSREVNSETSRCEEVHEPHFNSQDVESSSCTSHNPSTNITNCETTEDNSSHSTTDDVSCGEAGASPQNHNNSDIKEEQIRIKLKFLNDSQKLALASLCDQLGEFKRRQFAEDIGNNKRVKLIFNGQVLQRDQLSLQAHGLFDNCVVHCLVSSNPVSNNDSSAVTNGNHREVDLSNIMLPLFALMIVILWYLRLQYKQFFNYTSTFTLIVITVFFIICFMTVYNPINNVPVTPNGNSDNTNRQR